MSQRIAMILPIILWVSASLATQRAPNLDDWSPIERALIDSLSIFNLGQPPRDPSNRLADNPSAARLGEKIFSDPRFSANGKVSCSSCHRADYQFTDSLRVARGVGELNRRSMTVVGMAHQRWFFWDGRKDSLWSQSLAPLEHPLEHGISRTKCVQLIYQFYREDYQQAIGPLPQLDVASLPATARPSVDDARAMQQWQSLSFRERQRITAVFVNTGKSLAAFVRRLQPSASNFDRYARALATGDRSGLESLTAQQVGGLRLFISEAKCINCHNGPLLTNGEFHHVGTPDKGATDRGRAAVLASLGKDEFNYFSRWSDADPKTDGAHLKHLDRTAEKYEQAFKTPSLRNVATRPPYMHAGQFDTLSGVLKHYRALSGKGLADEIFHADLSDDDLEKLEAFLEALTSN